MTFGGSTRLQDSVSRLSRAYQVTCPSHVWKELLSEKVGDRGNMCTLREKVNSVVKMMEQFVNQK